MSVDLLEIMDEAATDALAETFVITLCGSARFEPLFHEWNERLTLEGLVVYGLSVYPSQKAGRKDWYDEQQKETLDLMHFAKIAKSNAILVLNPDGYVGESTAREIELARRIGRDVYFLHGADAPWSAESLLGAIEVKLIPCTAKRMLH